MLCLSAQFHRQSLSHPFTQAPWFMVQIQLRHIHTYSFLVGDVGSVLDNHHMGAYAAAGKAGCEPTLHTSVALRFLSILADQVWAYGHMLHCQCCLKLPLLRLSELCLYVGC